MKLVDILARELNEWPLPEHEYVVQEIDGELFFYKHREDAKVSGGGVWHGAGKDSAYPTKEILLASADDWDTAVVRKSEWQSARAAYLASIQPARDPEIAAVVDKPSNPWRRNRGRKTPPVPVGTPVDVKYRDGHTNYGTKAGVFMDCAGSNPKRNASSFEIDGFPADIMQWRYAEPQQEKPMAQTIDQVIDNAESAASEAFNPIALRDEFKRITAEGAELSQKMAKLNERMEEIEDALRAEGFALVDPEKHNAD
jgi:hypothetical protein